MTDPAPNAQARYGVFGVSAQRCGAHVLDGADLGARVRALAECIQSYDDTTSDAETCFEALGAAYACLLIDHLDGHQVSSGASHWVAMGAHGFVDPFDTMDRILQNSRPMAALAAELQRAELEASGRGGVGKVMAVLREMVGPERIASHFASQVGIGDDAGQVRLLSLVPILEKLSDATTEGELRAMLGALLSTLGPGFEAHAGQASASAWLPRIVSPAFSAAEAIFCVPVMDSLCLGFATVIGARIRFANARERIERSEIRQALKRLDDHTVTWNQSGNVWQHASGDGFAASRVLGANTQSGLLRTFGGNVVFSVPHRDVLLVAARTHGGELKSATERAYLNAPHKVSADVYGLAELRETLTSFTC